MPVLQCRLGGDFSAQLRGAASSVTGFKDVRIAPSLSTRSLSSSARCSQTFFIAFRPVPLSRLRPLRGCRGDLRGAMNQSNSLVKYDSAVLVVTSKAGKQHAGKKLPPVESKGPAQAEDILNSILPPREWTEGGQLWVQYVSSTPATRLDVINLQEKLDQQLQQRQARETGICPVREELYAQCFDELIRQVTINCAERGLLLLRVRDEMRMTISAYQTLYESAVAFGMRKALQAEQGRSELLARIDQLESEKADLEKKLQEQVLRCEQIEKREQERREAETKKHNEDKEYFASRLSQLKQQLDAFTSSSKK